MPDPVAEHISNLEQANRQLQADNLNLARERTAQAELAVRIQDEINMLRTEREALIVGLKHLYQHLTNHPLDVFCEHVHESVRSYVQ